MDIIGGAEVISDILKKDEGALIGRFGTVEFDVLYSIHVGRAIPSHVCSVLEGNAGVFPSDMKSVKKWAEAAKDAMCIADVLAVGWYEPMKKRELELLSSWGWSGVKIPLRSLEPYYVKEKWSKLLTGDVCVVSSFAETAAKQIKKNIWPSGMFEDSVKWHWVRTGYSPSLALGSAGWESSPESWKEAVEWVVGEVMNTGARTVIIGCGGLGMLIGAELKRRGKICIVMGGAVQVLFGIKGRRWENHEISKFWNSEWVWPDANETPGGAKGIERGCYWGGKS